MKLLKLSNGNTVKIDDHVWTAVQKHSWYQHTRNYVSDVATLRKGKPRKEIFLKHYVLGMEDPRQTYGASIAVGYKNDDPLDCRIENLLVYSKHEAMHRRMKHNPKKFSSQYKGVSLRRDTGMWRAYIKSGDKLKQLGQYKTERDAALAYDTAAFELWGEYARLNFPKVL